MRSGGPGARQRVRTGEDLLDLACGVAFDRHQRCGELDEERELAIGARGAGREAFEEPERVCEVVHRFEVGVACDGGAAGVRAVRERALELASRLEVRRELARDLADPGAEGLRLALADAAMKPDPAGLGDPVVEHFPVQGVRESVAGRDGAVGPLCDAGRADHLGVPDEGLAAALQDVDRRAERRGDLRHREVVADYARGLEQALLVGVERSIWCSISWRSVSGTCDAKARRRGSARPVVLGEEPLAEA
jgi:hypothetical protein